VGEFSRTYSTTPFEQKEPNNRGYSEETLDHKIYLLYHLYYQHYVLQHIIMGICQFIRDYCRAGQLQVMPAEYVHAHTLPKIIKFCI